MLQQQMLSALTKGLRRKSLTSCSRWAMNYVHMGKPFPGKMSFKYHPWTKEMHDSNSSMNVGQKAAQVGYTVAMLNRALYKIDVLKESVLYLLPAKIPDAMDFSSTKFDPALEMSPYLAGMFTDVKNMGTKRAGSAILYIRGSNSRKGLKSISVSEVIGDEYDEMPEHTVPLAQERMAGQPHKTMWLISTPRFPGKGINLQFLDSTQEHFMFTCPSCSKRIELKHENLIVTADNIHDSKINDSHVICLECKAVLFDNTGTEEEYAERKAEMLIGSAWEPQGHKDYDFRGFYVNQLYSPTVRPKLLAVKYLQSLTNKSAEQEYHNSNMGEAHEVEGARVTEDMIANCFSKSGRTRGGRKDFTFITMGVDVGKWLHYEICAWEMIRRGRDLNINSKAFLLAQDKKNSFEELDELMRAFQIRMCIVDAQPETRQAINFANRFYGAVKLCRYGKNLNDKTAIVEDNDKLVVTVDRTSWLDLSLGRFHQQTIDLPIDLSLEYRSHIKNIGRIYEEDNDGNQIGRYISNGDDHFAHARNYCEIALPFAAANYFNTDIKSYL